jgi:hypothetical protein
MAWRPAATSLHLPAHRPLGKFFCCCCCCIWTCLHRHGRALCHLIPWLLRHCSLNCQKGSTLLRWMSCRAQPKFHTLSSKLWCSFAAGDYGNTGMVLSSGGSTCRRDNCWWSVKLMQPCGDVEWRPLKLQCVTVGVICLLRQCKPYNVKPCKLYHGGR